MSKISDTFAKYGKVYISYLMVGDVSIESTEELIWEMINRKVHIIELGVPFSDPLADGTTIQRASQRALNRRINLTDIFGLVRRIKRQVDVPFIVMSYYNPVYKRGVKNFLQEAQSVGIDGIIIPDLPPEEASEFINSKLDTIFLVSPTSQDERIQMIANLSSGFIYCVSVTGTTGARKELSEEINMLVGRVRKYTCKPIVVGFGVSSPDQVREIIKVADGVIVGSAILEVIDRYRDTPLLINKVGEFIEYLIKGIR